MIQVFSGAPEDSEDDAVIEKHSTRALYTAVKSLIHAIQTKIEDVQYDAAHQMIHIAMPWLIRRCTESILTKKSGNASVQR